MGPCTQVQGRGGHVHRDIAPKIRCIRAVVSTKTLLLHLVRTTTTTTLFPSVVGRPVLTGLMVGMDVKDSSLCFAGLAGSDTPHVMFPSGVARPRMPCIMAVMDQKDSSIRALVVIPGSGMCRAGFTGDLAPRTVFLFLLSSGPDARHLGPAMVPVVQTAENCRVSAVAVHYGRRYFLSWRRCRFPWSFFSQVLQLQHIDKVVDVCGAGPAVLGCSLGGDSKVVDMRVVCNDICRGRCPGAFHRRLWTSL